MFILLFFSNGGVVGSASSSDSAELPVSSMDSSPSSDSSEGSFFFFFFILVFYEDGSELGVSESLPVFFAFPVAGIEAKSSVVGGISILAIPATKSLTCFCGSGVFTSSRDFCGISFGGGDGA